MGYFIPHRAFGFANPPGDFLAAAPLPGKPQPSIALIPYAPTEWDVNDPRRHRPRNPAPVDVARSLWVEFRGMYVEEPEPFALPYGQWIAHVGCA